MLTAEPDTQVLDTMAQAADTIAEAPAKLNFIDMCLEGGWIILFMYTI